MALRNLDWLRGLSTPELPDLGSRLHEVITDMQRQQEALATQTNSNLNGNPQAPPRIDGLTVTANDGHFQIAVHDRTPSYRAIQYFVEHADNPNFVNSHTEHLGDSRNANLFLGNSTRYFRAYSSYASSPPGEPAYHGTAAQPLPVVGGVSVPGPSFLPSQGSGTGAPGVGLSGPGTAAFRSLDGQPPKR